MLIDHMWYNDTANNRSDYRLRFRLVPASFPGDGMLAGIFRERAWINARRLVRK